MLPAIGITRLLQRSRRTLRALDAKVAERGHPHKDWSDFDESWSSDLRDEARRERADLWSDLALIGGGLLLGAAANIASLLVDL